MWWKPLSATALAAAWRDALLEPHRRASDGAAARARVAGAFDIGALVREYEQIYRGDS